MAQTLKPWQALKPSNPQTLAGLKTWQNHAKPNPDHPRVHPTFAHVTSPLVFPALPPTTMHLRVPPPPQVWYGFDTSVYHSTKYKILFEHRNVMRKASGLNYSSYVYVEDDTRVPWAAMLSWAWDTEVLEPLVRMLLSPHSTTPH